MRTANNLGAICSDAPERQSKLVAARVLNLIRSVFRPLLAVILLPLSASAFLMTDTGPENILIQIKQSLLTSGTLDTELASLALFENQQGMTVQKRWAGVKYIELLSFKPSTTEQQAEAIVTSFQQLPYIEKVVAASAFNLEFQTGDFGQEFAPNDVIPDPVRRALANNSPDQMLSPLPDPVQQAQMPSVTGQLIVRWKDYYVWNAQATGFTARAAALNAIAGTTVLYNLYSSATQLIQVLSFDRNQYSLLDELNTYGASDLVAYVQPDFLYSGSATPNDPWFTNPGQPDMSQIQCPAAWDTSTGSDAWVVAVGDTGANVNHPDFLGNLSPGYHNFVSNNSDVTDDSPVSHGSNVASVIGAQGNNGQYMTGVDWNVELLILKILGPNGGSSSTIAAGIENAFTSNQGHSPALAMNLSLGNNNPSSSIDATLQTAIGHAKTAPQGMVVVAAAGNNGIDEEQPGNLVSPADVPYDNVIAVGSVNASDQRSSFSNYGRYRVELAAPGENILGLAEQVGSSTSLSGTSQATPHVTGVLELVKNLYPWEDYFGIKDRVLMSTDDVPGLAGFFRTGGRLNARRALLHRTLIHNLSTRARVESGDRIAIGGFIIKGNGGPLKVALRGLGPELPALSVPRLTNPTITLNDSAGHTLAANDDWGNLPTSQKNDLAANGLTPTDSREAALVVTLNPGSYTLFLKSQDGNFGVGLFEIYELSGNTSEQTRLTNVSTRCLVETGDNVAIAGTIISANASNPTGITPPKRRLLMRGLGPTLASFGVSGTLANPYIELHNSSSVLASNDQWADVDGASTGLENEITSNGFAPKSANESILWPTLTPGNYSTILSGVSGGIGIGLIEFYER
jgi:thermitase